MQKPNETKQLALYSAVCAGLCILLQIAVVFMPQLLAPLYGNNITELTLKWRFYLIALILIRLLPLGGVALWNYCRDTMTRGKAKMTVILAPVLYVVGMLAGVGSKLLVTLFLSRESVAVVSAYSAAISSVNMLSLLGTASLILICCAGAIELYITSHTPSDGA